MGRIPLPSSRRSRTQRTRSLLKSATGGPPCAQRVRRRLKSANGGPSRAQRVRSLLKEGPPQFSRRSSLSRPEPTRSHERRRQYRSLIIGVPLVATREFCLEESLLMGIRHLAQQSPGSAAQQMQAPALSVQEAEAIWTAGPASEACCGRRRSVPFTLLHDCSVGDGFIHDSWRYLAVQSECAWPRLGISRSFATIYIRHLIHLLTFTPFP